MPLRIWEVPGFNLSTGTGYPVFSWFPSVTLGKRLDISINLATSACFHIPSNSSFVCHPITQLLRTVFNAEDRKFLQVFVPVPQCQLQIFNRSGECPCGRTRHYILTVSLLYIFVSKNAFIEPGFQHKPE
jgi:hypothetical protein